jgi:hypothetical protein
MITFRQGLSVLAILVLAACAAPTATPIPPTPTRAATIAPPTAIPTLIPATITPLPTPSELMKPGSGNFSFTDAINRRIMVYYYLPEATTASAPVLFVLHGTDRNGRSYRDAWVEYAKAKRFVLVVPEYPETYFPDSETYNLGDLFSESGAANNSAQWTFTSIEKIFDVVKSAAKLNTPTYHIYGHSAGGQFVHRFVMFMPNARFSQAVAANPGWYTMPQMDIAFPYGLKGTSLARDDLGKAFGRALTLLLGELDTDENDKNLRNTPEAKAQGKHRLERGKTFFATSQQIAATMQAKFNWGIKLVPNIGHSNGGMAKPAADWLFP